MKRLRMNRLPGALSRKTPNPPHRFEFIRSESLGSHPDTWMVNIFEVLQLYELTPH